MGSATGGSHPKQSACPANRRKSFGGRASSVGREAVRSRNTRCQGGSGTGTSFRLDEPQRPRLQSGPSTLVGADLARSVVVPYETMLTHSSAKRKRIYAWPRSPLAGHMVRQTRM